MQFEYKFLCIEDLDLYGSIYMEVFPVGVSHRVFSEPLRTFALLFLRLQFPGMDWGERGRVPF